MTRIRSLALALFTLALANAAQASWYDDYEAGVAAARSGNWATVVTKMSAAIRGNGTESNKARTYGAIFISYHPYYYRGIGYLNTGKYEQAIADLERTQGAGELDLGPIGAHIDRAKRQLAAASEPVPEPTRPDPRPEPVKPVITTPPPPVVPQIDAALRQRATAALNTAKSRIQQAQSRRATASPQYTQALSIYSDATARIASAKSNDDLNAILALAGNAGDLADLAMPPATVTPVPAIATTKPAIATQTVLSDYEPQLRRALEDYFNGEFGRASRHFEDLSAKLPSNGWIWAFLGASQYSQYAFEADDSYRQKALRSFRKAKALKKWGKAGLPDKYFSKRIRRAFDNVG
jgi:tetratricopeptide (TPR) repeat protein